MKYLPYFVEAIFFAVITANAATITPKAPVLSGGCYEISDAAELYGFVSIVNGTDGFSKNKSACGKLKKDIVVNDDLDADNLIPWNPLDTFAGSFDGNGHTISGLFQNVTEETDAQNLGFIRVLVAKPETPTVIKNLGIVDSYFEMMGNTGVRAAIFVVDVIDSDLEDGKDSYAKILNCYNQSQIYVKGYGRDANLVERIGEHVVLTMENSYSVEDGFLYGSNRGTFDVKNSYILDSKEKLDSYGIMHVTSDQFRNGAVAFALHEADPIWGQNVQKDKYPNFSGAIKNSKVDRYSVTFHTFTGDTADYFKSYISGFSYDLPDTVVKENTAFLGWFKDKEFSGKRDTAISTNETGNLEYWAKLKDIYKITFHLNGGYFESAWDANYGYCSYDSEDDFAVCRYLEGFHKVLPVDGIYNINRKGFFLVGWYDNEELTGERIDAMVATDVGNKDFYAKWFKLKTPALDAADNCYEISDVEELYGFARIVNANHYKREVISQPHLCGKLTKNIVVNSNVLKRDGTLDESRVKEFLPWPEIIGSLALFDGQGHKISGLFITDGSGFFNQVLSSDREKQTVIRNLTIDDTYSEGSGIVGYAELPLTLENCHFKGYIDGAKGGLVSFSDTTLVIKNSSHRGKMSAKGGGYMGGLVGSSYTDLVLVQNFHEGSMKLYADTVTHDIDGTPHVYERTISAGGLVGHLLGNAFIVNNYSVSDIEGPSSGMVGGLIGSDGDVSVLVSKKDVVHYHPKESFILNNYNKGSFPDKYEYGKGADKWIIDNTFYLSATGIEDDRVRAVSADAFENGTLATALHDYVQKDSEGNAVAGGINGDVWTQGDYYPVFAQKEKRNFAVLHKDTSGSCSFVMFTPGETVSLPVPEREGYTFEGWYRNAEFSGGSVAKIAPTDSGDLDFYAKWEIKRVNVFVEADLANAGRIRLGSTWSNGTFAFVYDTYDYGKRVYVEAVPNDGYRFVEWNTVCGTYASCNFTATETVSLVAHFEKLPSSSSVASSSSESSSSVASSSSAEPPKSSSSSAKSSSSVSSSSSAKSSSSSVKSSSSSVKSSSSSAKSSSSSAKTSSSSSSKGKSSSSKTNRIDVALAPQFSVTVLGNTLQVANVRRGARYALFDMQGNMVLRGTANSTNFNVNVPTSGSFVLRVGNGSRKVNVFSTTGLKF